MKKNIDLLLGQTYEAKDKFGSCCKCGRDTIFWLHNADNYFCLTKQCFNSLEFDKEIQTLESKFDRLLENLKRAGSQ